MNCKEIQEMQDERDYLGSVREDIPRTIRKFRTEFELWSAEDWCTLYENRNVEDASFDAPWMRNRSVVAESKNAWILNLFTKRAQDLQRTFSKKNTLFNFKRIASKFLIKTLTTITRHHDKNLREKSTTITTALCIEYREIKSVSFDYRSSNSKSIIIRSKFQMQA